MPPPPVLALSRFSETLLVVKFLEIISVLSNFSKEYAWVFTIILAFLTMFVLSVRTKRSICCCLFDITHLKPIERMTGRLTGQPFSWFYSLFSTADLNLNQDPASLRRCLYKWSLHYSLPDNSHSSN